MSPELRVVSESPRSLSNGGSDSPAAVGELRAAASVLIERMQWMRQHGITFNGLRDMYEVLGYDRCILSEQYRERYTRGGIAGRIVDAFPTACWRGDFEIIEDEDPANVTAFESAWLVLEKKLKLKSILQRTDLLAAQGRYAIIFLGATGDVSTELPKAKGNTPIAYVQPFAEEDAWIASWDTNISSERFGRPLTYQLKRMGANAGPSRAAQSSGSPMPPFIWPTEMMQPIHWTRVIHVPAAGMLDNEVFGPPALERVWNLLDDLDKVTGGGAEAFWLRANQGVQLDVDKDMKLGTDEINSLKDQADEYQHQIRRMLRTRGVSVKTLGSDVANFSNPADAILTQIAGAKSIPKRILTGSEMGQLASSQDRDNWKDQVDGRQKSYCEPYLIRELLDRLIAYRYLPQPAGVDDIPYQVRWPTIQNLTEEEKFAGAQAWAGTNNAGDTVFTTDEIRDKWYGMAPKPVPAPEAGSITNPDTGLPYPVDPTSGMPLDPATGLPLDPTTGLPLDDGVPQVDAQGNPIEPAAPATPFTRKNKFPRAASRRISEALLLTLESAIRENNTAVIDAIIGVQH